MERLLTTLPKRRRWLVSPKDALRFGPYEIKKECRDALFDQSPFFCAQEVVGTFLGHNSGFLLNLTGSNNNLPSGKNAFTMRMMTETRSTKMRMRTKTWTKTRTRTKHGRR